MKCFDRDSGYQTVLENTYCSHPSTCRDIDVLFIGSGIGLAMAGYVQETIRKALDPAPTIAIVDAGPADVMTHLAHTRFPRREFLNGSDVERVGGRLSMWGASIPRPSENALNSWPYDPIELRQRFDWAEKRMGGSDPTPGTGGYLEQELLRILPNKLPGYPVRVAPLAINRDGRRWCPLDDLPGMVARGLRVVSRFRVSNLVRHEDRVVAVEGNWRGNLSRTWVLKPKIVVLAVGVEPLLPLLRQIAPEGLELQASDHIRIDAHGNLPIGHFGKDDAESLGISVLLMDYCSESGIVPAHFEIKVAPRSSWKRGLMQSSDNLRGPESEALDVQIQCVSATHDRLPNADLLNVGKSLPPVFSMRDVLLHGELCQMMIAIAGAIGLRNPAFCIRPLLTNHHCYGALRVGRSVTAEFRLNDIHNVYVLPPSAYIDQDDDANPTLKSIVLSTFAMDSIIHQLKTDPAVLRFKHLRTRWNQTGQSGKSTREPRMEATSLLPSLPPQEAKSQQKF